MNKTIVDAKEKSIIKEPKSIKAFIKKYHFAFICFLSSLPLIALGICSFLFLYHPTTQ
jgi:hypothetical protein